MSKTLLILLVSSAPLLLGQKFSVDPAKGVPGGTYVLTVTQKDCTEPGGLLKSSIEPKSSVELHSGLTGLGIATLSDDSSALTCKGVWKATLTPDVPLGRTSLTLLKKGSDEKTTMLDILPFEVIVAPPGPLPPGLDPQVDVMWKIMPWKQTADSFGRKVANQYFCFEVMLGNNTGYPIQFTSLGFITKGMREFINADGLPGVPPLPNDSYNFPRSTIEKEQQVGKRAMVLNITTALGSLMAAGSGLFGSTIGGVKAPAALAKTRYDQISALMNPVGGAMQIVWPDRTTRHLVALDNRGFRDGIIIPSNVPSPPLILFISRPVVECDSTANCADVGKQDPQVRGFTRIPANQKHFNTHLVMEALGDLVLVGQPIKYLPRVSVSGNKIQLTPIPPVIFPQTIPGYPQNTKGNVLALTGNGLTDVKVAVDSASKVKATVTNIDADGKSLRLSIEVADDAPPGQVTLTFSNSAGSATFPITVTAAKPKITLLNPASRTQQELDGKDAFDVEATGSSLKRAQFQQDGSKATSAETDAGATITIQIPKNSAPRKFAITANRDGATSDPVSFELSPSPPVASIVEGNSGVKGAADAVHVSVTGKFLTGVTTVTPDETSGLTIDRATVKPPKPDDQTQTLTFDVAVKNGKIPTGTEKVWKLTLVNGAEKVTIDFTLKSK